MYTVTAMNGFIISGNGFSKSIRKSITDRNSWVREDDNFMAGTLILQQNQFHFHRCLLFISLRKTKSSDGTDGDEMPGFVLRFGNNYMMFGISDYMGNPASKLTS